MYFLLLSLLGKVHMSKPEIKKVKFKDDCKQTHHQIDALCKKLSKCDLKKRKNIIHEINIINPNNVVEEKHVFKQD
ncbi:hypothetical protein EHP00_515 [Ecytonucleospora hepatopenaei]|uniref:Uncharacterized protein n=1 Tax=Ecytonucleospora hepatopenaei TaxID=646526 RepID=A0A1W0E446_9MICR|nr:hypothetical protein EHP00_515 [Ecytonucleospora hepatopenaei]